MALATSWAMSWSEARRDAELWLDQQQLKKPEKGETLDLRPYGARLEFQGRYRLMVINAIGRTLKGRGIKFILPE